jgi:hypothetical protein
MSDRQERKTEEQVLAELSSMLEFAEYFFRARGKAILAGNIAAQRKYFESAEAYQHMEDEEEIAVASMKSN